MCEIDCAICVIQMDELMLVALIGSPGLSLVLLPTQAEKEKLQQAGDRNFERVLLLTPQQPLPKRGGERGAGQEVQHHSFPGG